VCVRADVRVRVRICVVYACACVLESACVCIYQHVSRFLRMTTPPRPHRFVSDELHGSLVHLPLLHYVERTHWKPPFMIMHCWKTSEHKLSRQAFVARINCSGCSQRSVYF